MATSNNLALCNQCNQEYRQGTKHTCKRCQKNGTQGNAELKKRREVAQMREKQLAAIKKVKKFAKCER